MHVIAHIRKATRGAVSLDNTHPFMRELWGRYWIFAHNGTLENFAPRLRGDYRPVGTTDSELAFCCMLEALRDAFPAGVPPVSELLELLQHITGELARHGTFNYLLSNGEYLFAHCADQLSYVVRQAPFTTAHLLDEDVAVDFSQLTKPDDRVAVIATLPLTDNEEWTVLGKGELALFRDGARILF